MWGEEAGSPAPLVPSGHTHQVSPRTNWGGGVSHLLEVLTKIYSVLINSSHSIWKIASAERMWGEEAGNPAPLVPEGHTHQVRLLGALMFFSKKP